MPRSSHCSCSRIKRHFSDLHLSLFSIDTFSRISIHGPFAPPLPVCNHRTCVPNLSLRLLPNISHRNFRLPL